MPNYSAKAQDVCPNPPPDCWEPFLGPYSGFINIGPCVFEYKFCYRLACGVYRDVFIGPIINHSSDDPDCSADIFNEEYYKKRLVHAAMADVVGRLNPWDNPMESWGKNYVPPPIPNCTLASQTQWRFFKPNCWSEWSPVYWDEQDGNLKRTMLPCFNEGALCVQTYRYCWQERWNPETWLPEIILHTFEMSPPYAFNWIRCDYDVEFIHPNTGTLMRLRCDNNNYCDEKE